MNEKEVSRAREIVRDNPAELVFVPGIKVIYYNNINTTQKMVLQYSNRLTGINGFGIKIADPDDVAHTLTNAYAADYLPDLSDPITCRILGLNDNSEFVEDCRDNVAVRLPSAISAFEIKTRITGVGTGSPVTYERYAVVTTHEMRDKLIKEGENRSWNPLTVVQYDEGYVAVYSASFIPCLNTPLPGYEAAARKAALAKLTPYDRKLLGISDDA